MLCESVATETEIVLFTCEILYQNCQSGLQWSPILLMRSRWRLFGKWQSQPLVGQPLFRRQLSPYFPVYDHHYLLNCHQREFAQHACHKSTKNICSIFKNHKFTNICPIFELPHISGQQTGRTVTDADYAFPCTMFGIQRYVSSNFSLRDPEVGLSNLYL